MAAETHYHKQFQQLAFQPLVAHAVCERVQADGGAEVPEELRHAVLYINVPDYQDGRGLDCLQMMLRLEVLPDGSLYVLGKMPARRVRQEWQRWSGPPPATSPVVQAFRAQIPQYSASHGVADRLRLMGAKVAHWLSVGKQPVLPPPDPRLAHIGPWLHAHFPLGPYHRREGRLVGVQEGTPWLLELDRTTLEQQGVFRFQDISRDFVGVLASPHIEHRGATAYFLLRQDGGAVANSRHSSRYRLCSISAERGAAIEACFAAPPSLLFAWTLQDPYTVVCLCPWRKQARDAVKGWSVGGLWDSLQFQPAQDALIHVLSRGQLVAVYRTEAIFMSGIIRSRLDGDDVVFEANCYPDDHEYRRVFDERSEPLAGTVRRYRLCSVSIESARFVGAAGQLDGLPIAVSDLVAASAVEGCVTSGTTVTGLAVDPMLDHSFNSVVQMGEEHAVRAWQEEGRYPASPLCLIRAPAQAFIAGLVLNARDSSTELLVWGGDGMTPVLRFRMPAVLPVTHANWAVSWSRNGPAEWLLASKAPPSATLARVEAATVPEHQ